MTLWLALCYFSCLFQRIKFALTSFMTFTPFPNIKFALKELMWFALRIFMTLVKYPGVAPGFILLLIKALNFIQSSGL